MSEVNKNNLEQKLQSLIETVDVANSLTEPMTNSIENLLKITSTAIGLTITNSINRR